MTCKDCFHYEACNDFAFGGGIEFSNADKCKHFKDKSLFIEMPCRVGNTVWLLTSKCKYAGDKDEPWNSCKQYWDNVYDHKMWGCAGKDKNGERFWCKKRKMELYIRPLVWEIILLANENLVLGKNLFLTKEAAEKALKEGAEKKC